MDEESRRIFQEALLRFLNHPTQEREVEFLQTIVLIEGKWETIEDVMMFLRAREGRVYGNGIEGRAGKRFRTERKEVDHAETTTAASQ